MALSRNDAQTAQLLHLRVGQLPLRAQCGYACGFAARVERLISFNRSEVFLYAAAQHNVGTATRHIRGDGDGPSSAGLGNDVGFAVVLFGVQHFVWQACLL